MASRAFKTLKHLAAEDDEDENGKYDSMMLPRSKPLPRNRTKIRTSMPIEKRFFADRRYLKIRKSLNHCTLQKAPSLSQGHREDGPPKNQGLLSPLRNLGFRV